MTRREHPERDTLRHLALPALVLALGAFNLFFRLGSERVRDFDEARHGINALEMARSGDYLVTTFAGEPDLWNLKPPLGAWLVTASYAIAGPGVLALRLPSALAGLLGIAITMRLGRRWMGGTAGVLAGAILATSLPYLVTHGGRTGDYDMLFTLAVLCGIASLPGLTTREGTAIALGAAFAAAFLLKGFAAGILLAIAAVHLLAEGGLRRLPVGRALEAASVGVLPIALWAALRYRRDGLAFLGRMLTQDVLARSSQAIENASSRWSDYAGYLLDRMAPWSEVALVAALVYAWRRRGRDTKAGETTGGATGAATGHRVWGGHGRLLACWILVPLVLFTAARTHRLWYLNVALPGLALAAAAVLAWGLRSGRPGRRAAVAVLVAGGLLFGELRFAGYMRRHAPMTEGHRFLGGLGAYRGRRARPSGDLTQGERFMIEVVSGIRVDGPGAATRPPLCLVRDGESLPAGAVTLRSGGGFRLAASPWSPSP